jgi:hypothetical protein
MMMRKTSLILPDVLGQKRRQPVDNTPASAVKGSQARGRQRHR